MKNKTKGQGEAREEQMYEPIKAYLRASRACKYIYADLPGEHEKVHLPRNLSRRDPDVVGITKESEVHLAEGKCLTRNGHAFDECVNQVTSLKPWADYLYVFFPWNDWHSLGSEDLKRNERCLHKEGIGLLLVDEGGNTSEALQPRQNSELEKAAKDALLKERGILDVPKIGFLSSTDASNVMVILKCFCEVGTQVAGAAVLKVLGEKAHWECSFSESEDKNGRRFPHALYLHPGLRDISVDLDFLGGYLADGHSCIWVTREVIPSALLRRLQHGSRGFGTHVNFPGKQYVLSLRDVNLELVRKSEQKTFWLMHYVEFFGRSREGLRIELEELLTQARKLA